jgi:hypothetical protein
MARSGITVRTNFSRLDRLIRQAEQKGDDALRAAAQEITNDIVQSFGTSPSSPGDPPGVDTGALRASMRWEKVRPLHYEIMDGVEYGAHLELGTSKMAARPFFTPVLEEWRARKFARFMSNQLDIP